MRKIKLFYFWLKLIWKVIKLKDWALLSDVLFIQDEKIMIALSKYEPIGDTIEEKEADLIEFITLHYMLKQTSEFWPVSLNYEVGKMYKLNKIIRKYQHVVDDIKFFNDLI